MGLVALHNLAARLLELKTSCGQVSIRLRRATVSSCIDGLSKHGMQPVELAGASAFRYLGSPRGRDELVQEMLKHNVRMCCLTGLLCLWLALE